MADLSSVCDSLKNLGEFYGAGLFEEEDKTLFERFSRASRRYFENYKLPPYNGEPLYPCGSFDQGLKVRPDYSFTVWADINGVDAKDHNAAAALYDLIGRSYSFVPKDHGIGGDMYTHSHPNFKRVVTDGFDSYAGRIAKIEDQSIREGLLDIIAGIRVFHSRILKHLDAYKDSRLYKALLQVPFKPARDLYEALVCWNFVYYLDGCDNIGRLDADLYEYYRGEDVTDVLSCFFKNVDDNCGWTGALGPSYNELTLQCLKAVKGRRRPSLELRVTPDMPDEIWEAAVDSIKAGGGQPSLYNEEGYQRSLKNYFPEIPDEDLIRFAGGGCTETMLAGISNVGSLDAGINVALIFNKVMREKLPEAKSFEEFYGYFIDEYTKQALEVFDGISKSQKLRSTERPQPMRTLLVDDCIDKGKDFNNGGARYYWSVVNLAGVINVIDSMLVIDHIVFKDNIAGAEDFLKLLDAGESFLGYKNIPRHGMDSPEANEMAERLSTDLCGVFDMRRPYLGGKFLPSSIQFTTYGWAGSFVGATPDGRKVSSPLCDSIGAVHNNDKKGVTALLNSASCLCQDKMAGTPVLNIRLDPNQITDSFKALVNGYFKKGGMQMQLTCTNAEDIIDALAHPERHENLIVRIGGFSEYFNRLSPELRQTVADRTIHSM